MSALFTLLASKAGTYVIGALAILAAFVGTYVRGRLSGAKLERNANRAKEADAYERHLQDIADAAVAKPRGLPDHDPNNRDIR